MSLGLLCTIGAIQLIAGIILAIIYQNRHGVWFSEFIGFNLALVAVAFLLLV
jgi:hypothetical protein